MNIKNENGMVTFVMRTGKDFVRSTMPLGNALTIAKTGKEVSEDDKRGEGVEICVDNTYFFPIEQKTVSKSVARRTEEQKK